MAQRRYTIVVPKRIMQAPAAIHYPLRFLQKIQKQAIKRAAKKALESGNYFKNQFKMIGAGSI